MLRNGSVALTYKCASCDYKTMLQCRTYIAHRVSICRNDSKKLPPKKPPEGGQFEPEYPLSESEPESGVIKGFPFIRIERSRA